MAMREKVRSPLASAIVEAKIRHENTPPWEREAQRRRLSSMVQDYMDGGGQVTQLPCGPRPVSPNASPMQPSGFNMLV